MALTFGNLLHCVVLFSTIQYCSAYCYGYCWYGSWYIWFGIVMVLAICCGAIGSFIRRRQIQKAMRNQRTQIVTVDINGQTTTTTMNNGSDRPYVYPQSGPAPYPTQPGGAPYPAGTAPYPTQQGAAPYPTQPGAAPYPAGSAPYPPGTEPYPNPGAFVNTPPPYSSVTSADKEEKISTLPPTYQEAVRHQGYFNQGATFSDATPGNAPQSTTNQSESGANYTDSRSDPS